MRHALSILALTAAITAAAPVRGDVRVTLGTLQLPPGGMGYLDATISGADDPLWLAGFEFRISTAGPTRLEFVDPQPLGYLSDPDYVFHGDSYDAAMLLALEPMDVHVGRTLLLGRAAR